jgi:hypothetical protein
MPHPTLTIPARFNGPPGSANGGYTCGLVGGLLGAEVAEVSLRAPPPLERPLTVRRDGGRLELLDGDALVAEAVAAELPSVGADPISPSRARAVSEAGYEHWSAHHPFPTCVVCGPNRDPGDGMRLFPGAVGDGRFALEWIPDESVGDGSGRVRPECVWAALDCPTSAPVANFAEGPAVVLARLTARVEHPVAVGEPHAIVSWPIEVDGRKRHAAAGLFDSEGRLLSASRALWIELRQ